MRATKSHHLLFVQNDLLTPMGISNYRWEEGEGYHMLPRDLAKLGLLFHRRGEYHGTRLLSAAWVDSALRGYEPNAPLYFNHWAPIVHFADGIPVQGLLAGGWGGQSITIFPALNTIIVMTGGNMLEPADYDVCIREYVLPAILTPQYRRAHPEFAYQHIRRSKNLEWTAHWDTEMGCLSACAKSLGRSVTDPRLYGATGVGFLINIDERAEPKSMAVWNKSRMYELCRNLGFSVESIWSHKSSKDFHTIQKLVWDRVRQEIDSGHACYGFHLGTAVRYLIIGYDDCGYYYKGWQAECGKGPVRWEGLGQTTIGLLGMHFVCPVAANVPFRESVKQAFQFVLEFSANSPRWVPGDCKAGPEGYERWISILESGKVDEYGLSYNAVQLAEARRFAADFLEEAKVELGSGLAPLIDRALRSYKISASDLEHLSQTFPHNVLPAQRTANLKDPRRRQEAIRCLREARAAEVEGLKAVAAIAEKL